MKDLDSHKKRTFWIIFEKIYFFTIGSRNQLFGCQHRDRSRAFANICSLGSFHFFDSCDKNLMGVFIFFDCCDKNLIVLSRQLLIPLNSSKDDNSFVIIFLFLKFEIFVLFLLPTVKKIVYILLERMLIFPSVLCSPRASPSGYKLHLRKNHAFLSLNI
jgi:hypothetical protein